MRYLLPKFYCLQFFLFLFIPVKYAFTQKNRNSWYSFSSDNKECIINNSNLPTPWLNRLGNDVFFTWVTQNGYTESYLLDPVGNALTNSPDHSGRFYIADKDNGSIFQVNKPSGNSKWEARVGLGYNKISNKMNGLATQVTYFVPRGDNVLISILEIRNDTHTSRNLGVFSEVEWNLGDATKSFIYKGDGRGGSQFNLYKRAYMEKNIIIAKQPNWKNTATCNSWPYTGFFSVSAPVTSYETVRNNFLGTGGDYDHPLAVEKGICSNTDFWSEADYPVGVLNNSITLKPGENKTLVYILGMSRDENTIRNIVAKYTKRETTYNSLHEVNIFYDSLLNNSISIQTPDKENDRIINIWTKYIWRQFWKKSLNNGAYGLGLWSYNLEGDGISVYPEQFLLPFDESLLKNGINDMLRNQTSDTLQTDLYESNEHTMLYKDLGLDGPVVGIHGSFKVPHHHQLYGFLYSLYYYLLETRDIKLLDTKIPYIDGKTGTGWEHLETALDISTKGIDDRGLPQIPAGVGDWMDEFTRISVNNKAESEMLAGELCYVLRGFAGIADQNGHKEDSQKWMSVYNRIKNGVNKEAWDGGWYIRAFSDRGIPSIPIGSKHNDEGKIYLNAQSWPILSGIASPERATKSLLSVKKYLMSDYGPMIFTPAYTHFIDYIGTQSIYAPGFRNACIYLRPAGWAIAAACLNNQADLANEMYDKASMKSREKDMEHYHCEPYIYPENYDGPDDQRLKGQGEFQWNFGEGSAWMWTSYVDYILGIRPVQEGLLIDPKIPSTWPGYRVKRPFCGCIYNIDVKNPSRVDHGIASVKVDGERINSNVINPYSDGKEHTVEVIMGSLKK